jgi:hypothetical protein
MKFVKDTNIRDVHMINLLSREPFNSGIVNIHGIMCENTLENFEVQLKLCSRFDFAIRKNNGIDGNRIAIENRYTTSLLNTEDVLRTASKFEVEGML